MTRVPLIAIIAFGLVAAGCGSSASTASKNTDSSATTVAPPGPNPSASSKMICSKEAQTDIATSIGVKAVVTKPTWVHHVYACNYTYPNGTIALTVKENASAAATTKEYNADAATQGRKPDVVSFGQGAFLTNNGSVIVRKDFKVLDIDVSKLPMKFGEPLQNRSDVALSIAATVMSCWTGA